jgi:CRP-like cAMP-binding protein
MQSSYSSTEIYHFISCRPSAGRSFKVFLETEPELQSLKHQKVIPKGVALFTEGESPKGIYILISGRIMLTTGLSNATRIITHIVEFGQVLGLSASILATPNECTAVAAELCHVEFIKREDLLRLMNEHKEVCLQFARLVSEDYRRILDLRRLITLLNLEETRSSVKNFNKLLNDV